MAWTKLSKCHACITAQDNMEWVRIQHDAIPLLAAIRDLYFSPVAF